MGMRLSEKSWNRLNDINEKYHVICTELDITDLYNFFKVLSDLNLDEEDELYINHIIKKMDEYNVVYWIKDKFGGIWKGMNMNKNDFTVGQTVYLMVERGSNVARGISDKTNIENWILKRTVKLIGKKYITVTNENFTGYEIKFDIANDFRQVYSYGGADYRLFLSKEEIMDYMNSERIYDYIKSKFNNWDNRGKFSLEQLKAIEEIIG